IVITGKSDSLSIRADSHASVRTADMIPKGVDEASGTYFPKFDGFVCARRNELLPIRAEGDGFDPTAMPVKGANAASATHIPESKRLVITAGSELVPVGAEGHGVNKTAMPFKGADEVAGVYIPEPDR